MTIDFDLRQTARDLYVIEGMTHEEVSQKTEVPIGTIKRWSSEDNWKGNRAKHRETITSIKNNSIRLKEQLMAKALKTLSSMDSINPQDMHGFRSILAAAEVKEKDKESGTADIDRPKLFLEDMEFVAEVLKEIDPEGLKILSRNFDEIVRRFKEKHEKQSA